MKKEEISFSDIMRIIFSDKISNDNKKQSINKYINYNIRIYSKNKQKEEFFPWFFSSLQSIFFNKGKFMDRTMEIIFLIQEAIMDNDNIKNTEEDNKEDNIPNDYFMLINSLFEVSKTLETDKRIKFLEKIQKLFEKENAFPFILKFSNEIFEIIIYYSRIDQDKKVNEQGKALGKLFEDNLNKNNNNIYLDKFEKLLLKKIQANQPILAQFLVEWINILITISFEKKFLGIVFLDFIEWIMKTENDLDQIIKEQFLEYFDDKEDKFGQIKNCIACFIKLVRKQKEQNQQEEYQFLIELVDKMKKFKNIIKEIFPFDTLNNFLLLILQAKEVNSELNILNTELKELIEEIEYKDINEKDFKETIQKGMNNPNFEQKTIAMDWYLLICEKNKGIIKEEEVNKDIINIILKTIDKNIEDNNNENLFLLILEKLCQNDILILFDLLSDNILSQKYNYNFKYKISGYLNNFLIDSSRAKELKESLINHLNINKEKNNDFTLFEKMFKIFAVNPMCLLIFCIYIELYELGWELILNFKNIKLEDDYYKYLAIFVQAIDNKQWNEIRLKLLFPNKYIYFIKCLYGILMLLPQGKAFSILSDRLYSIKGLLKSKNNFDQYKKTEKTNDYKKYIDIFMDIHDKKDVK